MVINDPPSHHEIGLRTVTSLPVGREAAGPHFGGGGPDDGGADSAVLCGARPVEPVGFGGVVGWAFGGFVALVSNIFFDWQRDAKSMKGFKPL